MLGAEGWSSLPPSCPLPLDQPERGQRGAWTASLDPTLRHRGPSPNFPPFLLSLYLPRELVEVSSSSRGSDLGLPRTKGRLLHVHSSQDTLIIPFLQMITGSIRYLVRDSQIHLLDLTLPLIGDRDRIQTSRCLDPEPDPAFFSCLPHILCKVSGSIPGPSCSSHSFTH